MEAHFVPWFFLVLGIVSRILVPWLIARRDDPSLSWTWRYIWPQLVSFVVIVLMLPLLVSDLANVSTLELQVSFLVGLQQCLLMIVRKTENSFREFKYSAFIHFNLAKTGGLNLHGINLLHPVFRNGTQSRQRIPRAYPFASVRILRYCHIKISVFLLTVSISLMPTSTPPYCKKSNNDIFAN